MTPTLTDYRQGFTTPAGIAPRPAVNALTPRQQQVFDFVVKFRGEYGYSPTMTEAAIEMGVSKVTAFEHVHALKKKGWLIVDPNVSRSMRPAVESLPPDEALRSGVADAAARMLTFMRDWQGRACITGNDIVPTMRAIRADLVALLARGGKS